MSQSRKSSKPQPSPVKIDFNSVPQASDDKPDEATAGASAFAGRAQRYWRDGRAFGSFVQIHANAKTKERIFVQKVNQGEEYDLLGLSGSPYELRVMKMSKAPKEPDSKTSSLSSDELKDLKAQYEEQFQDSIIRHDDETNQADDEAFEYAVSKSESRSREKRLDRLFDAVPKLPDELKSKATTDPLKTQRTANKFIHEIEEWAGFFEGSAFSDTDCLYRLKTSLPATFKEVAELSNVLSILVLLQSIKKCFGLDPLRA